MIVAELRQLPKYLERHLSGRGRQVVAGVALYLAHLDCREGDWTRQCLTPDWQAYMDLRTTYYEDELVLLTPDNHVFDDD